MPQVQGAGTVFTGGPGTALRGPLYVKSGPKGTIGAQGMTFTQISDANGEWAVQIASIQLTSAQILTLFSAPVQLLPAPGAGFAYIPDFVVAELQFLASGGVAYAAGGAVSVTFGSGGPAAHTTPMPAALVTAAQSEFFQSAAAVTTQQLASAIVNQPLFVGAAGANFTTGNGTLLIKLGYRLMSGF